MKDWYSLELDDMVIELENQYVEIADLKKENGELSFHIKCLKGEIEEKNKLLQECYELFKKEVTNYCSLTTAEICDICSRIKDASK